MAYQARGRDPLMDSGMQAALERRGRELLGVFLALGGMLMAAMLASYTPTDPSLFVSTNAPAQNWLGAVGSNVATVIMMGVGWGGWTLPALFVAWGVRICLHRGDGRVANAVVFGPLWMLLAATYAAGHAAPADWAYSFGPGGVLGDLVLGPLLTIVPLDMALRLAVVQLALGCSIVLLGLFVLGFTRRDVWGWGQFLITGLLSVVAMLARLTGLGASRATAMAAQMQTQRRMSRETQPEDAEDDIDVIDQEAPPARVLRATRAAADTEDAADASGAPAASGLGAAGLSLLNRLVPRRSKSTELLPEPELVTPHARGDAVPMAEDQLRARIGESIRRHQTHGSEAPGVGPDPLILDTDRREPVLRAEPTATLSAGGLPLPPAPEPVVAATVQPQTQATIQARTAPTLAPPSTPTAKAAPVVTRTMASAMDEAHFELPPLDLLMSPDLIERHVLSDEALQSNAQALTEVLRDYGVKGDIVNVRPGPVVTMYELEPAAGLKASRVIGLADDIARSMSALSARVSTVPGRSVIGIELPNDNRETVALREILAAPEYEDGTHKLPLALGKDIGGDALVTNLAKMPHLLIAGTTGSGKSVAINTMILSLLYKLTPDECRLIMIDPKMLELSVYDGIPHLLSPVVTDPKKAVVALKWVVAEMEERYRKMSKMGVRNIDGYNSRVADALGRGEMFSRTVQTGFDDDTGDPVFETEEFEPKKMPYIVVVVDEMADLMMVAGKEIEACIQRLAQMARASGIHLIMATQRPSVDVITGTIKANFPTRISFQVTSKIDSRTILGEMGAEQLLGM
ncbi:MAG: DNA translocase FtsK 4TM domain-containing protein, partial [Primorskyibacter sp.]